MIFEKELIAAGYKKYTSRLDKQYADYFYQKRFSDDEGKKYFINFSHYPANRYGQTELKESWNADVQFITISGPTVDIEYFSFWTEENEYNHPITSIEDVEQFFEKMWETNLFEYYEKWD